jgi:hypothetical protein
MMNNSEHRGKKNDVALRNIYASLLFRNKDLNPDLVTELLGIKPLKKFKKGESYGIQRVKTRQTGFWYVSTEDYVQSDNIEHHLLWLLEKIERVTESFMEIVSREKLDVEITCVLQMYSIEDGFSVSAITLKRIAELKIRFGVSLYCLGGSGNWS